MYNICNEDKVRFQGVLSGCGGMPFLMHMFVLLRM
jgi:hypothetical protein